MPHTVPAQRAHGVKCPLGEDYTKTHNKKYGPFRKLTTLNSGKLVKYTTKSYFDKSFNYKYNEKQTYNRRSTLKEIISQTDYYKVNLSSKTYIFEDKMTKY